MYPVTNHHQNTVHRQELNSRAQGEVSIREALRELEVWGVGAVFNFSDFQDSTGKTIKLIKEWKDLLNEVCTRVCERAI